MSNSESSGGRACNVHPSDCLSFEVCTNNVQKADKACKFCFPDFVPESDSSEDPSDSDSSVDSSSGAEDPAVQPAGIDACTEYLADLNAGVGSSVGLGVSD